MNDNIDSKTKDLLNLGTELVGIETIDALKHFRGGPVSATLSTIQKLIWAKGVDVVADIARRDLSHREKVKVGAGLVYALAKIEMYLNEGKQQRNDGFFEQNINGRSPSDEILEGTLLKCKNEHEEKKLKLIGNIYANTAFMPEVLVAGANWMLQKCQELTYRQICIVALVERKEHKGASWGPNDGDPAFQMEYQALDYMFRRDRSSASVRSYERTGEGLWVIGLSRVGKFCYEVMGLQDIPEVDLLQLKLRFPRAFD